MVYIVRLTRQEIGYLKATGLHCPIGHVTLGVGSSDGQSLRCEVQAGYALHPAVNCIDSCFEA